MLHLQVATPNFDPNTGGDLREAKNILQDVAQRYRRVFGPSHPDTLHAESDLSGVREELAHA